MCSLPVLLHPILEAPGGASTLRILHHNPSQPDRHDTLLLLYPDTCSDRLLARSSRGTSRLLEWVGNRRLLVNGRRRGSIGGELEGPVFGRLREQASRDSRDDWCRIEIRAGRNSAGLGAGYYAKAITAEMDGSRAEEETWNVHSLIFRLGSAMFRDWIFEVWKGYGL
ncbi:hypothetical protein BJ508DRAFT_311881 [Ascobolus immersus RN42]|uniref:Uncharacterized protein n=1 Tax=Ascobolus immersus RN42 TaxID=1160509 RepID=A0A3N4I126_ASCIM|nr:hypothetical protein BJ508DRAFT_311881 [Ascobolus immersus RN42]